MCKPLPPAGGTELVLSGINLGRWGRDLKPERTLEELVSAILSHTALPRLRLSSIEPMDWTPQLLALFREPLCDRQCAPRAPRPSPVTIRIGRHPARHASPLPPMALRGKAALDS